MSFTPNHLPPPPGNPDAVVWQRLAELDTRLKNQETGLAGSVGPWVNLTLEGEMEAFTPGEYGTPAYRHEGLDVIRLRGLLKPKAGKTVATSTKIFTLPKPVSRQFSAAGVEPWTNAAALLLATTGEVLVVTGASITETRTLNLSNVLFFLN